MHAIEVRDLSKVYRIYAKPVDRLKEAILRRPCHQAFQPLRGVSFAVPVGGTLGIIGENGAGKSTLLKILADTLTPSGGSVLRRGRVAALLELGAGFHPEFTGRENIHLNAALLGLSDAEIRRQEHAIIDFSELGQFIDRPIKTYSSGMAVRLGFSIATCVDPDILIIDEALSVGDQHFQKKCVDRMMQFRERGKTLLFCSHSMYLVEQLCHQAVWLRQGQIAKAGSTRDVTSAYSDWVRSRDAASSAPAAPARTRPDAGQSVWIKSAQIIDAHGAEVGSIVTGDDLALRLRIGSAEARPIPGCVGVAIERSDKVPVFGTTTLRDGAGDIYFRDDQEVTVTFPRTPLLAGRYSFLIALMDEHGIHIYQKHYSDEFSVHTESGEAGMVSMARRWTLST